MWLLLACAVTKSDSEAEPPPDPPGACSLTEADGTEACPVDPCAACASVEEGLACCLTAHGMGTPGPVTVPRSIHCATEQTYDPADYWSEDAARCAAQVYGLGPGIDVCQADLSVCDDDADWYVMNLSRQGCGWWEYEGLLVGARDGHVTSAFTLNADGICDG